MTLYVQVSPDRREDLPYQASTRAELSLMLGSLYVEVDETLYHVHQVTAEPDLMLAPLPIVGMGYIGLALALLSAPPAIIAWISLYGGALSGVYAYYTSRASEEKKALTFNRSRIDFYAGTTEPFAQAA